MECRGGGMGNTTLKANLHPIPAPVHTVPHHRGAMIIDLSGIDQDISLTLQAYTALSSLSFLHLTAHLGDISRSEHKEQP